MGKFNKSLTSVWIGIAFTVCINLLSLAFTFGQTQQQLTDMNCRLERIERAIDNKIFGWLK